MAWWKAVAEFPPALLWPEFHNRRVWESKNFHCLPKLPECWTRSPQNHLSAAASPLFYHRRDYLGAGTAQAQAQVLLGHQQSCRVGLTPMASLCTPMLLVWPVLCVDPPAKSPRAVQGTLALTAREWLQWAPETHEWLQNLNQAHFVPPFLPMLSSADVSLKQPQSTEAWWGKRGFTWLSPLESVRLNTESLWPKQATLSSGTDPALVEVKGNFVWFCWLLWIIV